MPALTSNQHTIDNAISLLRIKQRSRLTTGEAEARLRTLVALAATTLPGQITGQVELDKGELRLAQQDGSSLTLRQALADMFTPMVATAILGSLEAVGFKKILPEGHLKAEASDILADPSLSPLVWSKHSVEVGQGRNQLPDWQPLSDLLESVHALRRFLSAPPALNHTETQMAELLGKVERNSLVSSLPPPTADVRNFYDPAAVKFEVAADHGWMGFASAHRAGAWVPFLRKHGCSDTACYRGEKPIVAAIMSDEADVVKSFLDQGYSANGFLQDYPDSMLADRGRSHFADPSDCLIPLTLFAARNGAATTLMVLSDAGASLEATSARGDTADHFIRRELPPFHPLRQVLKHLKEAQVVTPPPVARNYIAEKKVSLNLDAGTSKDYQWEVPGVVAPAGIEEPVFDEPVFQP